MTAIEREVTAIHAKQMPQYHIRAEEVEKFPSGRRSIEMRDFAIHNNRKFIIWGRPKH